MYNNHDSRQNRAYGYPNFKAFSAVRLKRFISTSC